MGQLASGGHRSVGRDRQIGLLDQGKKELLLVALLGGTLPVATVPVVAQVLLQDPVVPAGALLLKQLGELDQAVEVFDVVEKSGGSLEWRWRADELGPALVLARPLS